MAAPPVGPRAQQKDLVTLLHQVVTLMAVPFVLGVTGYFAVQFDGLRLSEAGLVAKVESLSWEVHELEHRLNQRAALPDSGRPERAEARDAAAK